MRNSLNGHAWPSVASICAFILLSACAGDLGDARDSAKKAATFVGSMQQATLNAIDAQKSYRQIELTRSKELEMAGEMNLASVNQYQATWAAADMKDAREIYKAVAATIPDADLTKTAPFVMLLPMAEFSAPAVDRKSFTSLIEKFNKLSRGLSPIDRAEALAPFVEVVVKAYGDSVKSAKNAKPLASGSKPAGGSVMSLSAALTTDPGSAAAAAAGRTPTPPAVEELETNEVPINGLLSALGPLSQ